MNVIKTNLAIERVKEIYKYSVRNFGRDVADQYIDDLTKAEDKLVQNPFLGRIRPEFSLQYRILSVRNHYIAYQIIEQEIFILTIEHHSRDIPGMLDDLAPIFEKTIAALKNRNSA